MLVSAWLGWVVLYTNNIFPYATIYFSIRVLGIFVLILIGFGLVTQAASQTTCCFPPFLAAFELLVTNCLYLSLLFYFQYVPYWTGRMTYICLIHKQIENI